jgi:hypothetical protein
MTDTDQGLRSHLLALLDGEQAHISFRSAIKGFPEELINTRVVHLDHNGWELVFHMQIVQWDILEFIKNPAHISPEYPHGYWPDKEAQADPVMWKATIDSFGKTLSSVKALASDRNLDLFAPIPHGTGQTLLREILLVADHNSYHIGQLVDLRMLIGAKVRDY